MWRNSRGRLTHWTKRALCQSALPIGPPDRPHGSSLVDDFDCYLLRANDDAGLSSFLSAKYARAWSSTNWIADDGVAPWRRPRGSPRGVVSRPLGRRDNWRGWASRDGHGVVRCAICGAARRNE